MRVVERHGVLLLATLLRVCLSTLAADCKFLIPARDHSNQELEKPVYVPQLALVTFSSLLLNFVVRNIQPR